MHTNQMNSAPTFSSFKSFAILAMMMLMPMLGQAQCAMCRAALQSGGDTAQAQAVNDGIVYLMVIPYILIAAIGFYVYKSRQKKKRQTT